MIGCKNERAPRKTIQGARLSLSCLHLTFQKMFAYVVSVSGCAPSVAQRRDNQMTIAKKTRDMLLPTLRIHREHAGSHLQGPVYASMI